MSRLLRNLGHEPGPNLPQPSGALRRKFSLDHVIAEGSRQHVHSYAGVRSRTRLLQSAALVWCSEPFCRDNILPILTCIAEGLDPAEFCPLSDVRAWLTTKTGRAALAAIRVPAARTRRRAA